ncbi:MAG: hypothetical protein DRR15_00590 [Gammaproteobacteria bacterium]|nr:MAG: hypothetical protein DRR15_00590 [Gammaproteobacteria bacterium]
MKWSALLLSLVTAFTTTALPAAEEERGFFDGLEARMIGPYRGGRAMVAVGVRQDPHVYYMGTTGGVWKTVNAGASWESVSDEDFGSAAVGAIAVAPSDPNVVVVGMGESPFRNTMSSQGDGVYKSTDAGGSWTHIGLDHVRQIGEIRIHPGDPDIIWVAAQGNVYAAEDDGGIFKSTDGGATWRRVLEPANRTTGAVDLALDMGNPRILYAAMWDNQRTAWDLRSGGPGSGIWRSVDGGESWKRLAGGLPEGMGKIGVAASPAKAGRVWAIVEAEGDESGLYRSDNGGDTWKQLNKHRLLHTRSWYYMHVFADPVDENTVYVLNAPFMKSIDGGKTFSRISVPHGDNHYLWINPNEPRWMVNANDGGANVSFDGGASWSRQDNQPTGQFYRVNTDNRFEYRVYGGQQDSGTVAIRSRSRDGAIGRDDWEAHGGGESASFGLDPENPRYTYAGSPWGRIDEFDTETRTVRSVRAYEILGRGLPAGEQKYRFNWNAPIVVSQHDSDVIYHAANVLLKSTDRGYNWQAVSPDLTRNETDKHGKGAGPYTNENLEMYNTIFAVEESPQDANTLWAGTDDGLLHVTRDGGETWSEVTPRGVGRGMINSIDASEHVPGVAYVTAIKYKEGDNAPYAWRTDDYGQSWKRIAGGLPQDHFVRVVREDPERQGLLYAGMERGLFVSVDDGGSWQSLQLNLPVVPITDLMVRRGDLVLATQGRAFWIVDDLSPLRQYATSQVDAELHLYQPAQAIRLTPTRGRIAGGEMYAPSAPHGALIYYALGSEPALEEEEVVLEILNSDDNVIRRLATDVAIGNEGGGGGVTYALPAEAGLNRALWDLRTAPTTKVDYPFMAGAGSGRPVAGYHIAPGTYRLRLTRGDMVRESTVEVVWDPINDYDPARIAEQQLAVAEAFDMLDAIYRRLAVLPELRSQVEMRRKLAKAAGDSELAESARALLDDLDAWRDSVSTPKATNTQDVLHFPPKLEAFLANIYGIIDKAVLGLTQGQRDRLADLRPRWEAAIDTWDQIIEEQVAEFNDGAGPAMLVPNL